MCPLATWSVLSAAPALWLKWSWPCVPRTGTEKKAEKNDTQGLFFEKKQGVPNPKRKEKKWGIESDVYLPQIATKWGIYRSVLLSSFFMAFLCVSQQWEFKNTTKTKNNWEKYMSKTFYKEVEEKKNSVRCFPSIFFSHFWLFLYVRILKTPLK
jgi:hypothetical protein